MTAEDRFDGLFLSMAQHHEGIEPLLNTFFSFLRRKTDFFTGASDEESQRVVLNVLKRQRQLALKEARTKQPQKGKGASEPARSSREPVPVEAGDDGTFDVSAAPAAAAPVASPPAASAGAGADTHEKREDSEGADSAAKGPALEGNGGKTDRYTWTQTLQEVTIMAPIPRRIRGKDIDCSIGSRHLRFGVRGETPLVDAPLHKPVVAADCYWTLTDEGAEGKMLTIILQKENSMEWWKSIAEGEPEIDLQRVEPENSKLNDLDPETRKTVEKMMFDTRQKAMGKPTSEKLQQEEMMKRFMEQHPEMDFSNAKVNFS